MTGQGDRNNAPVRGLLRFGQRIHRRVEGIAPEVDVGSQLCREQHLLLAAVVVDPEYALSEEGSDVDVAVGVGLNAGR
ncbi:MAG: hypothetical protein K0R37_861 [Arthrobacter sp.]|nr:hypothetical protein [Arthrobacter sp.]